MRLSWTGNHPPLVELQSLTMIVLTSSTGSVDDHLWRPCTRATKGQSKQPARGWATAFR